MKLGTNIMTLEAIQQAVILTVVRTSVMGTTEAVFNVVS